MSTKITIALALAAGFIGGIASQHLMPSQAYAQTQTPKEIRARNFVVVDENGVPRGAFGINEKAERPLIEVN